MVEKEYEKLSEFLKFANLNNCFKDDKEVQIKLIELSDHTVIQINLVNSALLAFYKDKLKDGDSYFYNGETSGIIISNPDSTITVNVKALADAGTLSGNLTLIKLAARIGTDKTSQYFSITYTKNA